MKFSEYIIIESTGSSVDPLGFLRPSSAIADGLFKQFTVLSNHPAYQGFLAFVFLYLEKKGIRPGTQSFSKQFRDIEVLWGILNDRADVSILNVTKYAGIAKKPNVSLTDARKYAPLYTKLNYGTLGHYSSPSIFWGILDAKGVSLTNLGTSLGIAWSKRNGLDFGVMLDAWLAKSSVDKIEVFSEAIDAFNLTAAPSREERDAWKEIIKTYCSKSSIVQPLWNRPITDSIHALANDESSYSGYYQAIQEHYKEFTELCERIELAHQFETLAALSQFVFEWEYVNRLDEVKKIGIVASNVKDAVAKILVQGCTDYLKERGSKDAGKMFQTIAQARNYEEVASTVLTHHVAHQKAKGASPFVQGKEVIVPGRVDPKVFSTFLEILRGEPLATVRKITWRYRRNWHFQRAVTWLNYSKDPV